MIERFIGSGPARGTTGSRGQLSPKQLLQKAEAFMRAAEASRPTAPDSTRRRLANKLRRQLAAGQADGWTDTPSGLAAHTSAVRRILDEIRDALETRD